MNMKLIYLETHNRLIRVPKPLYNALGGDHGVQKTIDLAQSERDGHEEAHSLMNQLLECEDYPFIKAEIYQE